MREDGIQVQKRTIAADRIVNADFSCGYLGFFGDECLERPLAKTVRSEVARKSQTALAAPSA